MICRGRVAGAARSSCLWQCLPAHLRRGSDLLCGWQVGIRPVVAHSRLAGEAAYHGVDNCLAAPADPSCPRKGSVVLGRTPSHLQRSCSGAGEASRRRVKHSSASNYRRAQDTTRPACACLLRPVELELQLFCFGPGACCGGACCGGAGMAGRRLRLLLSCGDAQSLRWDGAGGHCLCCCCWRRRKADMVLWARFTACMHS